MKAANRQYAHRKPETYEDVFYATGVPVTALVCIPLHEGLGRPQEVISGARGTLLGDAAWATDLDTFNEVSPYIQLSGTGAVDFGVVNALEGLNFVSVWVEFKVTTLSVRQTIISQWVNSPVDGGFEVYMTTSNTLAMDIRQADGTTVTYTPGTTAYITANTWMRLQLSLRAVGSYTYVVGYKKGEYMYGNNIASFKTVAKSNARLLLGARSATSSTITTPLTGGIRGIWIGEPIAHSSVFTDNPVAWTIDTRPWDVIAPNRKPTDYKGPLSVASTARKRYVSTAKYMLVPVRTSNTTYNLGDVMRVDTNLLTSNRIPTTFKCVKAGTSAATQPTMNVWPATYTWDGTVVWQETGGTSWATAYGGQSVQRLLNNRDTLYVDYTNQTGSPNNITEEAFTTRESASTLDTFKIIVCDPASGEPPTVARAGVLGSTIPTSAPNQANVYIYGWHVCSSNNTAVMEGFRYYNTNSVVSSLSAPVVYAIDCKMLNTGSNSYMNLNLTTTSDVTWLGGAFSARGENTSQFDSLFTVNNTRLKMVGVDFVYPGDGTNPAETRSAHTDDIRVNTGECCYGQVDLIGCYVHPGMLPQNGYDKATQADFITDMRASNVIGNARHCMLPYNLYTYPQSNVGRDGKFPVWYVSYDYWRTSSIIASREYQYRPFSLQYITSTVYPGINFAAQVAEMVPLELSVKVASAGTKNIRVYLLVSYNYVLTSANTWMDVVYQSSASPIAFAVATTRGSVFTDTATTLPLDPGGVAAWKFSSFYNLDAATDSTPNSLVFKAYYLQQTISVAEAGVVKVILYTSMTSAQTLVVCPQVEVL